MLFSAEYLVNLRAGGSSVWSSEEVLSLIEKVTEAADCRYKYSVLFLQAEQWEEM